MHHLSHFYFILFQDSLQEDEWMRVVGKPFGHHSTKTYSVEMIRIQPFHKTKPKKIIYIQNCRFVSGIRLYLRKSKSEPLSHFQTIRPSLSCGSAHDCTYFVYHVCLTITRKEWTKSVQFSHNRTQGPYIDGCIIYRRPKEDLGCSIPLRHS